MQRVLLLCFLTPVNNSSEYLSSNSFKQTMHFLFSSFINFKEISMCQTNTTKLSFLCNVGNLAPSPLKKDGKVKLYEVSFKTSLFNGILHACTLVVHNRSWGDGQRQPLLTHSDHLLLLECLWWFVLPCLTFFSHMSCLTSLWTFKELLLSISLNIFQLDSCPFLQEWSMLILMGMFLIQCQL